VHAGSYLHLAVSKLWAEDTHDQACKSGVSIYCVVHLSCLGDKLEALVAGEAASQAAAASEVSELKAQLAQAEAAAAAAEQQADSLTAQLVEAQQALIDADRRVCTVLKGVLIGIGPSAAVCQRTCGSVALPQLSQGRQIRPPHVAQHLHGVSGLC
jgi:hypothetical protein